MSDDIDNDPHLNPASRLTDTACPKCGCYMTRHFACDCGVVHEDYCDNCGRFTSLDPSEFVAMSDFDEKCSRGAVKHAHLSSEKQERVDRGMARAREYVELFRWRAGIVTGNENGDLFAILMMLGDPLGGDPHVADLPGTMAAVWSRFGKLDRLERTAYVRAWLWARENDRSLKT